ncbi:MAG TPA: hypothetical protein DCL81_18345, partial [Algoriphagus sp.]|nr:hypothetical protein [Algoriphagus sp.]
MISIITFIWAFFQALNPVILNGEIVLLDRYEYLILEEDKDIKFQEIIERNDFTKIDQQSKNFGINNDVVWLKYVVENNSEKEGKYFYINNSSLDSLELFVVSENEILESYVGGRLVDFYSKPILSKSIIFDINLPIGKTSEIFLKVKSVNKKIITSTITNRNYLENLINRENILFGIFTGVIVGLFFYNLFLFFSVRDKLYLIYVIHTVLVWFAQSS